MKEASKIRPECGHEFQGKAWEGIDAHWRANHAHITSYGQAWPLISSRAHSRNKSDPKPPSGRRAALGRKSTTWQDGGAFVKADQYYSDLGPVASFSEADNLIHFEHGSWLGTERRRTDNAGNIQSTFASLPFGEPNATSGNDLDGDHFTGLDEDGAFSASSPGLHHATFREYNSTLGRWMSPDPYSGSYDLANPQSLNRYSYVLNNPLTYQDPTGLTPIYCVNNPTDVYTSPGEYSASNIVNSASTQSLSVAGGESLTYTCYSGPANPTTQPPASVSSGAGQFPDYPAALPQVFCWGKSVVRFHQEPSSASLEMETS